MSETFGDADPEDAWDPDDPRDLLIANLVRRLVLLGAIGRSDLADCAESDQLDHLAELVDRVTERLDDLSEFDRQRLRMVVDDLAHVRRRYIDEVD